MALTDDTLIDPSDAALAVNPDEGINPAQPAPSADVLGGSPATVDKTEGHPPFINQRLTKEAWATYVAGYQFGSLAPTRVVLHHTYIPDEPDWQGLPTMRGMQRYYAGLGWTSAPHIYAGPDGIWLATPMSRVGIHAGTGNGSVAQGWYSIGVEMVGFFDAKRPSGPVWANTLAVLAGLSRRLGIPPRQLISFHRDYTNQKSCPGRAVAKEWVWAQVEAALAQAAPSTILNGPSVPATTLIAYLDPRTPHLSWQQRQSIVTAYCTFGELTTIGNLRPFAQAVKEASEKDAQGIYRPFNSARFRTSNSVAGMGATNDGAWGETFATIAAGVLAQHAHLLCYAALPATLPSELQLIAAMSPRRQKLIDTFGLGSAPTWEGLNGKWAYPGPTYGQDILRLADDIVGAQR